MCGRLSSKTQREVIARLYHATVSPGEYFLSHNVAPTERVPIVREGQDHERTVDMARFGIPTTAPGRPAFLLINLQSEKAANRKDFNERRCIIPADGFYEWEALSPKEKQAHYFYPPEGLFSLAGVWKETPNGLAFSIFTTAPNEQVGRFHNRMPVILGHNAVPEWLAPEAAPETLMNLMQPYPQDLMREHKVSKAVNSPKNKDESCIRPV